MELKPVKYNKKYELLIAKRINDWFNDVIFKGCFEILKNNTVENAQDDLIRAIQSGRIFYQDGAFYSANGRFSNVIAKELENIGAKYSKFRKAYLINPKAINIDILWAIQTTKAKTSAVVIALQTYLTNQIGKLDEYHKDLLINTAVEQIMFDLQKRVNKTLAEKKIPTIAPEINDFRANEIARNYTNNLDFWIKDWAPEEMIKMRETVGQMAIAGKSRKDIADYIMAQKGVSERKALFLARNETGIATTSYLQAKYQDEGFTHFKWITNMDGRERPLHKKLNGKIFAFNDPPVIYQHKKAGVIIGEDRGLPQQTYNCLTGDMSILSPFPNFRIFRRYFTGELSEIVLPKGTIKITANHPILTDRGWVRAKDIQKGDKVAKIGDEALSTGSTYPNNTITRIDEFFSFYNVLFNSQRVSTTNFDFHGDISVDNKVDVINIESKLRNYIKPDFDERVFEFFLTEADKLGFVNSSNSTFYKAFPIGGFSTSSKISLMSNVFSFFYGSVSHSIEHTFGAVAWLNSILDKAIGYNTSANPEFFCKSFNTHTVNEQLYKLILWDIFNSVVNKSITQSLSTLGECFTSNSEHLGNIGQGSTFGIKFDTVQNKTIRIFNGHIYNLENQNNWYYTENYITKNCRCTFTPVFNKEFLENRRKK